jgi:hypothetical protein
MDEDARVRAALQHIGRGGDLADFPATRNEKRALIATGCRRRLITWKKVRGRYKLTSRGHRAWRHPTPVWSRVWSSARTIAITLAAVTLGLWYSLGASGLLAGGQPSAVALPATTPAQTAAVVDARPQPAPAGKANDTAEQRDVAAQPSTAPASAAVEPPKPDTPEANPAGQDKRKLAAQSQRKVAKSHRKRTYASRRGRNVAYQDPRQFHQPFHQPGYFSFGNQSNRFFR